MTARHSLASTYLPNLLLFKKLYLWRYLLFRTIFLNLKNSHKTNIEHIIILVNSLFRSRIGLITHGQVSGVSSSASWLDSGRYQKKRSPRQAIQRRAGMLYFTIWTRALGSTSAHAVSTLLIQSLYPRLRESADREYVNQLLLFENIQKEPISFSRSCFSSFSFIISSFSAL